MILTLASKLYGAASGWRRRWYGDSSRSRRLAQPVVSVGNLCTGGSGKTPTVAHVARLLLARGERPVILTRGYARPAQTPGVTVVSDQFRILATFDTAGDELLSCYQVWGGPGGDPASWRAFRLAEVSQLTLTTKRFAPRPEHQRGNGAIARVFCQV